MLTASGVERQRRRRPGEFKMRKAFSAAGFGRGLALPSHRTFREVARGELSSGAASSRAADQEEGSSTVGRSSG